MTTATKARLWTAFIGVISVALGICTGLIAIEYPPVNLKGAVNWDLIGWEVGLASSALTATFLLLFKLAWARSTDNESLESISTIVSRFSGQLLATPRLQALAECHPVIRDLAVEMLTLQLRSMKLTPAGFTIDARNWAMQSNESFWRGLIAYRSRLTNHTLFKGEELWLARCVHKGDPNIWRRKYASGSLAAQETFCLRGTITRVFIGKPSTEEIEIGVRESEAQRPDIEALLRDNNFDALPLNEQYGDIIRIMQHHNIEVYYSDTKQEIDDFTSISMNGVHFIDVQWHYTSGEKKLVDKLEFQDSHTDDRYVDWDELVKYARKFEAKRLRSS